MKKGILLLVLTILLILVIFLSNFFWFTGLATRNVQTSDQNTIYFIAIPKL